MDAAELAEKLIKDRDYLEKQGGGVTFSGGEPTAQGEFLLECLDLLGPMHKAIETSGYCDPNLFREIISRLDYVIMDLKLADPEQHKQWTGVDNAPILRNLEILRESGKPCVIRTPLIPGATDTPENLTAIQTLVGSLPWEKLPYNAMAGAKYKMLDMVFPMDL